MKKIPTHQPIWLFISLMIMMSACQSKKEKRQEAIKDGYHEVLVQEILQVPEYTYLLVRENTSEYWLAAPRMDVGVGETYYYKEGMMMKAFTSKALSRTFDSILFVDKIQATPYGEEEQAISSGKPKRVKSGAADIDPDETKPYNIPQKPRIEKADVSIAKPEGGVSISELYAKKTAFENKTVLVKGKVTTFNTGIMKRNWVHIQDGTSFEKNIDLTVTTQATVRVGEVVTFEGKISLKKDYGYGYSYEVIMENAVLK